MIQLQAEPAELEIQAVVKSLGPDKAPGPDGFNAKMVQTNWEIMGPTVLKEVMAFFQTGHMKQEFARSNLQSCLSTEN